MKTFSLTVALCGRIYIIAGLGENLEQAFKWACRNFYLQPILIEGKEIEC